MIIMIVAVAVGVIAGELVLPLYLIISISIPISSSVSISISIPTFNSIPISISTFNSITVFNLITSGLLPICLLFTSYHFHKLEPLTRVIIRGGGNVKPQLQPRAAATAARIATDARVTTAARVATATTCKSGDGSLLRSIPCRV